MLLVWQRSSLLVFVLAFRALLRTQGGLAGCVLADRLSADGKNVLVLEAGRPDFNYLFIRIPAGILRLFRSRYDWQYESQGEKACNGRNVFLQRGKVRSRDSDPRLDRMLRPLLKANFLRNRIGSRWFVVYKCLPPSSRICAGLQRLEHSWLVCRRRASIF